MERQIEAGIGINGRVMIGVVRFRTVGGYVPVALDVVPRLFAVRQPGGSGVPWNGALRMILLSGKP